MDKREELIAKLGELRREFEGFPEEQKVFDDAVSELSTNGKLAIPSPDEPVRVTDLLLMAKTLGAYCNNRPCDKCIFNTDLCCPSMSWSADIDAERLAEYEGKVTTVLYRKGE